MISRALAISALNAVRDLGRGVGSNHHNHHAAHGVDDKRKTSGMVDEAHLVADCRSGCCVPVVLIPSTWDEQQYADYTLTVLSPVPIALTRI